MSYNYNAVKNELFTEEGQQDFILFRDKCFELLKIAGAVRMQELPWPNSTWFALACADRLIEIGEIAEINYQNKCGQHRIFIKKGA